MADQQTETIEPTNHNEEPPAEPNGNPQENPPAESNDDVKDSHGQPGINKERHDREIAEKDKQIADLQAKLAEASKTEEGREELQKELDETKASIADMKVTHSLEMEGCIDVKSAKARLEDFGGDIAKLKEGCPHLFETQKQKGSTGKPPAGAADALDAKLDKAFGL